MIPNSQNMHNIKLKLSESLKIIKIYEWLLDSYVLDFYLDDHWPKMPKSWIQVFERISPEDISELLMEKNTKKNESSQICRKHVWPLSLLALKVLLNKLCVPRVPGRCKKNHSPLTDKNDINNNQKLAGSCLAHPKLKTILTKKNIKEKKRHEIEEMSRSTARIARECNVKYIVDFGAGLGHLARSLAYGYGLGVCCLEQQIALTNQAIQLDNQMESLASKYFCPEDIKSFPKPVHLNICLSRDTMFDELVQKIKKCFHNDPDMANERFQFGIIGLHPCGDLASILTNFFLKSPEAKFLNLVGCCYMKLTVPRPIDAVQPDRIIDANTLGYPLSEYLLNETRSSNPNHLSYEAREIACHAIEVYAKRLADKNYGYLRVHAFRASIEKIICKYWPERKHSGLKSIKHLTTFRDYCRKAVSHLNGIRIPDEEIEAVDTRTNLSRWHNVIIFYSLRLMLAPLVESFILYDRMLWLLESGCHTNISAIFDPVISSRNHIITALK